MTFERKVEIAVGGLMISLLSAFCFVMENKDTTRSVKIEDNTVTTQNVNISADIIVKNKDTEIRVYTPDVKKKIKAEQKAEKKKEIKEEQKLEPQPRPKPKTEIDWANKPKVLDGLGVEINGKEALELLQ